MMLQHLPGLLQRQYTSTKTFVLWKRRDVFPFGILQQMSVRELEGLFVFILKGGWAPLVLATETMAVLATWGLASPNPTHPGNRYMILGCDSEMQPQGHPLGLWVPQFLW